MSKRNKIIALIVILMVSGSTFIRWYVFEIDAQTNVLLSLISSFVLFSTVVFFRKLYAYFDKVLPYDEGVFKRLIPQILITFVFLNLLTRLVLYLGIEIFRIEKFRFLVRSELTHLARVTGTVTQILAVGLLNLTHFTYYSIQKWQENQLKASNLEKEKSQVQFDNLKNQLNPHFLFNSLTSLDSLIQDDPALAREFLQQLSKVFRYVLKSKEKGLVSLETELGFIKNYVSLLKTRFADALVIVFDIADDTLDLQITPVTLQILIENATKHNVINESNPLRIEIKSEGDVLSISNNLQRKKQLETSNGQGLINLQTLYGFLSNREITVTETDQYFTVTIPLI
ncbi:sensor histidine kinase [Emticicia sp. 21SJ11W-3]|uniref:sensor histidine kinase n=1 Tax=Emticicia sp. 21SJ11W-3 TaxID=2916755 RepID=UPI00209E75C3|nr:histidine kinase [Emticicia sp. 21SJ11W-3]UTA67880.1 histidine kinase [Emticicia sp. 21SJ11W-3]